MPRFLHSKDKFGNDIYLGDAGDVKMPAMHNIDDYSTLLQRIRDVSLRSDDVIVVGYPKSGNNWVHHMVRMLQLGTTDVPPLSKDNFHYLDGIGGGCNLPPPDEPRAFVSHLPFRFLPRDVTEKKVKVIYLTRNPKDVFVSLFCHLTNTKTPAGYEGTWYQFFEVMLDQGYWYGDVFDHMRDWEREIKAHPDHPIYHCNYEESKKDTLGQVERLDRFLGTGRGRALCEAIVSTCRVGNMHRTRRQHVSDALPWACWKDGASDDSMFRKGIVGDWKNWFTLAQNERFDDVYKTKMAGSSRTFDFE